MPRARESAPPVPDRSLANKPPPLSSVPPHPSLKSPTTRGISTAFKEEMAREGGWNRYVTRIVGLCQKLFPDILDTLDIDPMTAELPAIQTTVSRELVTFPNEVSIEPLKPSRV
jgi:hypothetical protein